AHAAAGRSRAHREAMIVGAPVSTWELERTPDLVDLVSAARDAGHEVLLIERPMPDAVSVAALGRAFDIVAAPDGVALEDATGSVVAFEPGQNRLLPAGGMWRRVSGALSAGDSIAAPVAVGGFAYRPDRDPGGPWSGFPALLFRVPALAVMRIRGRTFVTPAVPAWSVSRFRGRTFVPAAAPDAADLLDLEPPRTSAPAAHKLEVSALRNPVAWTAAVESAAARLRSGEAAKVVLAREVMARGDGVVAAGMVARSLRSAYPSCFIY